MFRCALFHHWMAPSLAINSGPFSVHDPICLPYSGTSSRFTWKGGSISLCQTPSSVLGDINNDPSKLIVVELSKSIRKSLPCCKTKDYCNVFRYDLQPPKKGSPFPWIISWGELFSWRWSHRLPWLLCFGGVWDQKSLHGLQLCIESLVAWTETQTVGSSLFTYLQSQTRGSNTAMANTYRNLLQTVTTIDSRKTLIINGGRPNLPSPHCNKPKFTAPK
jgi:hypothetical protein